VGEAVRVQSASRSELNQREPQNETKVRSQVQEKSSALPLIVLPTNEIKHLLCVRPTAAHVMAMAVQKLFPTAQCTIGPWIEHGFYYDFDMSEPFTERDLKRIKKEMIKIIKMKLPLVREEVSREDART
jgi:threonyl-tRNA synthetase